MAKKFFYRVFCGFFLGLSAFTPGLSGSIIAISMGIYQDLVRIASNPFKRLKENMLFLLPLAVGTVISAIVFVIGIKFLLETYEKATYFLFAGLIAGNLPVIFAEVKKYKFKKRYLIGGAGAFFVALVLGAFTGGAAQVSGMEDIVISPLNLALGGLAVGMTALVPGLSVSTILIIMGVYGPLIFIADSLLRMNFSYLTQFGFFGVCAVGGLVLIAKGIKAIFQKHPGLANTVVLGFIAGSLLGILKQSLQMSDANFSALLGAAMLAMGLGISMLFVVLGKAMDGIITPSDMG